MGLQPTDSRATQIARQSQRYAREIVLALVLTLAAAVVVIAAASI